jgi:hypothetical protein
MRMLLLTIMIIGSFAPGALVAQPSDCEGTPKNVTINYADSEIRVTPPVIKVHFQEGLQNYLRFKLNTNPLDTDEFALGDAEVKIQGKTEDGNWINVMGTANDNGHLDVCIPPSSDTGEFTFRYFVEIENVGKLDPRVIVVR